MKKQKASSWLKTTLFLITILFLIIVWQNHLFLETSKTPSVSQEQSSDTTEPKSIPTIEICGVVPTLTQIPTIDYKNQPSTFSLNWGEGMQGIGLKGYDPGACNGLSGGALPTQVQGMPDGSFWIADGYGPRLVHCTSQGEIDKEIPLPQLRRSEYATTLNLVGFTFCIWNQQWIYVLDTRNHCIYTYSLDGTYQTCISIDYVFQDISSVLQVEPFFTVTEGPKFHIVVHLKNSTVSDALLPEDYFKPYCNEAKQAQGFADVPLQPSFMVGLVLTPQARIVEVYNPALLQTCYSNFIQTTMRPLERQPENQVEVQAGFTLEQKYYTNQGTKTYQLHLQDSNWQGGGLIGTSKEGAIYYWVNQNTVGVLQPLQKQSPAIQIQAIQLPESHYHPVTVTPKGNILAFTLKKDRIQVYRFLMK